MTHFLNLTILSPEGVILDADQVKYVRVRLGGDSWLSIYPGHAPLIAELLPGELMYSDAKQARIEISTAIMQVSENHITVFVGKPSYSIGG